MSIKVILADDHQIVIEELSAVLEAHNDFEIVAVANNGVMVLEQLNNGLRVDVAVLDINMPEMDGLTCARRIKVSYPQVKVIMLTMYEQQSFVEEMLKIGIDGCLLKNNTGKELADAIIRVVSGKSYFDLIQTFSQEATSPGEYHLSNREIEIIRFLAEGLTSSQIAGRLFLSEHTVKTHRKNILRKTESHGTSQLIQFALNNHII